MAGVAYLPVKFTVWISINTKSNRDIPFFVKSTLQMNIFKNCVDGYRRNGKVLVIRSRLENISAHESWPNTDCNEFVQAVPFFVPKAIFNY
jgi:hypothetical protein